jgi:crotonobetainyl-CoA:carnitine CoA-transferase CaiB-like acyl-CoA transferase
MKLTVRDPAGNPVDLVGNPIHLEGAPAGEPTVPPKLGAQTDEVLRELGLTDAELAALRAKGVV